LLDFVKFLGLLPVKVFLFEILLDGRKSKQKNQITTELVVLYPVLDQVKDG
jgi:hypothetical protein